MIKSFGKSPRGARLELITRSPNYKNGSFQNLERTSINPKDVSVFKILRKLLFRPSNVRPAGVLPHEIPAPWKLDSEEACVTWFGHSSYLIQIKGFRVLIDPVFSGYVSPFGYFGKAFKGADQFNAEDMTQVDLLIITHDHYDHLDYPSLKKLEPGVKRIITPLGVGAHLEAWGISAEKIRELDWWDKHSIQDEIKITATPSRHFSGRLFKRNQTLWSSFVLEAFGSKFFLGGDSGYDSCFKEIGNNFGPFDLAFLECGQFGEYWPDIHMFPEQTVQAGIDLQAKTVVPVHWGKFVLSYHSWSEPVERFVKAAEQRGLPYLIPKIGETVNPCKKYDQEPWWIFDDKENKYERKTATLGSGLFK